jgi:excisionase family DNA binding protein
LVGGLVNERIPAELQTIPQVAKRLKVSPNTVYRLISAGELAVVKVGSVSRVSEEALQEYVDRNTRVAS